MTPAAKPTYTEHGSELLADVIERIEGELVDIARLIDANQSLIARLTWDAASADPSYVRAMQDADLISQKIAGIAGFLKALADSVPAGFEVDTRIAVGSLRLDELLHKIGARGREQDYKAAFDAGDFEMF